MQSDIIYGLRRWCVIFCGFIYPSVSLLLVQPYIALINNGFSWPKQQGVPRLLNDDIRHLHHWDLVLIRELGWLDSDCTCHWWCESIVIIIVIWDYYRGILSLLLSRGLSHHCLMHHVPLPMRDVIRVVVIDNLERIVLSHIFVRLTPLLHQIRMLLKLLFVTLEEVEALDGLNGSSYPCRGCCCHNFLMIGDIVLNLSHQICVVIQPKWVLDVQQWVLSLVGLIHCGEILVLSQYHGVEEVSGLLGWLSHPLFVRVTCRILNGILNDLRQEDLWKLLMRLCLLVSEGCGFPLFLSVGLVSLGWRALRNH